MKLADIGISIIAFFLLIVVLPWALADTLKDEIKIRHVNNNCYVNKKHEWYMPKNPPFNRIEYCIFCGRIKE